MRVVWLVGQVCVEACRAILESAFLLAERLAQKVTDESQMIPVIRDELDEKIIA